MSKHHDTYHKHLKIAAVGLLTDLRKHNMSPSMYKKLPIATPDRIVKNNRSQAFGNVAGEIGPDKAALNKKLPPDQSRTKPNNTFHGTICKHDPDCYVPNNNPYALYVIGFNPGIQSEHPAGKSKKPDPSPQPPVLFTPTQAPVPLPESQLTQQGEINDEYGRTPDLTQYVEIDGVLIKNGKADSPSNINTPSDSSLFAPTPLEKPMPYKKPSTPYPYDMIRAINDAIIHSPQPEIVQKTVYQTDSFKNMVSYYTYTPMTKSDIEKQFNITIEDPGEQELGVKRSTPGSTNQPPNKRIKTIRHTETWERIQSNTDQI